MIYNIPVTAEPLQEQTFRLFGYHLRFTLRYNTVSHVWNYDLYDLGSGAYICQSFGLAVNAPSLFARNLPFVIVLQDTSGLGLNSIDQNEMGDRLRVLMMDKDTYYEAIRTAN